MTITVVNMIPKSNSGETNQDSEPNLAVNRENPLQIAGSAFTPNPQGPGNAPIYVSVDGENTWSLNPIVPSRSSTADITLRFGKKNLYAGIIKQPTKPQLVYEVLRTKDFTNSTLMEVLLRRKGVDQPWIEVFAPVNGSHSGKDLLYVGNNDFGNQPLTATIDISLDGASSAPTFNTIRIDSRAGTTDPQDAPAIRPAIHDDGRVYAAFYEWTSFNRQNNIATSNVVVVRDNNFGMPNSNVFSALVDTNDGGHGVRVVSNIRVPFDIELGQQRLGGDLSLAVDPTNSSTVYLAYAEQKLGGIYTLHVIRSIDGGSTWSSDLRSIESATNPALAINDSGRVGFLYQQFIDNRWNTHFEMTSDGFKTRQDSLLATVPADNPPSQFDPYLGDYDYLTSVKNDFYGIFSTSNEPNKVNFPSGIIYQRNADFDAHKLLDEDGSTEVSISIDPFFFKVT